jgi:hypothetical protein
VKVGDKVSKVRIRIDYNGIIAGISCKAGNEGFKVCMR